jgi:hypothetical protein
MKLLKVIESEVQKDLSKGIQVEREHMATYMWVKDHIKNNDPISFVDFCLHIAADHHKEHKDYYARLEKEGL